MAETATLKKAPSPFSKVKKADLIIYKMLAPNEKLRDDTPLYPPLIIKKNTDVINYVLPEDSKMGRKGEVVQRAIRYLHGEQSIFVDEQEANGRTIPLNVLTSQRNNIEITEGEIKVRPTEKAKIQFLDYVSWNVDSPYRNPSTKGIIARHSEEKQAQTRTDKQKLQRDAFNKAFEADEYQIAYHAKFLGISLIDVATAASRTIEAVRADYQQRALDDPDKFLETYDDEDLKFKYLIFQAIGSRRIVFDIVPGKATWVATKADICDMPVNVSQEATVEILFNFSRTQDGDAFTKQVKGMK